MFPDPRESPFALLFCYALCLAFGYGLGEILIQLGILKPWYP